MPLFMSTLASGLGAGNLGQAAAAAPQQARKNGYDLNPEDFINMMVTQLQNQDPMEPAKNEELLSQMSQIGQLQSSTSLHDSLQTMTLQNSLGSAGNLIGKHVQGLGDEGNDIDGVVTSVRVEAGNVWLELDTGNTVRLDRVTEIDTVDPDLDLDADLDADLDLDLDPTDDGDTLA